MVRLRALNVPASPPPASRLEIAGRTAHDCGLCKRSSAQRETSAKVHVHRCEHEYPADCIVRFESNETRYD